MTLLLLYSGILPHAHSSSSSLVLSLRVLACLHLMTGKYSLNNSTSCFSVLLLNSHPHFSLSFWFTDDLLSTITDVSTLKLSSASLLCFLCRDFPTFSPGHSTLCAPPPPSLSSSTPPYRFLVCFPQALVLGKLRLLISLRSLFISTDLVLTTTLTAFSSHGKLYRQTLPGPFCQYSGNFAAQFHSASFLGIFDVQHRNPNPGPQLKLLS